MYNKKVVKQTPPSDFKKNVSEGTAQAVAAARCGFIGRVVFLGDRKSQNSYRLRWESENAEGIFG